MKSKAADDDDRGSTQPAELARLTRFVDQAPPTWIDAMPVDRWTRVGCVWSSSCPVAGERLTWLLAKEGSPCKPRM